jgi:hypothetical protein
LVFLETAPAVVPWPWYEAGHGQVLARLHRQMRQAPYHADRLSGFELAHWAPKLEGDCKRKSTWLGRALIAAGFPPETLRIYVGAFRDWRTLMRWRAHAILLVRITRHHGAALIGVADLRRDAIAWIGPEALKDGTLDAALGYRNLRPRVGFVEGVA